MHEGGPAAAAGRSEAPFLQALQAMLGEVFAAPADTPASRQIPATAGKILPAVDATAATDREEGMAATLPLLAPPVLPAQGASNAPAAAAASSAFAAAGLAAGSGTATATAAASRPEGLQIFPAGDGGGDPAALAALRLAKLFTAASTAASDGRAADRLPAVLFAAALSPVNEKAIRDAPQAEASLMIMPMIMDGAGGGSVVSVTAAGQPAATPLHTVALPPGAPGWADAFGERVLWLVGQRQSAAYLSLNPPELGPLEVRIIFDGADKVQIHFASAHHTVREAVEQALPRLREMLGASGLELLGAEVHHDWGGAAAGRHGGGGAADTQTGFFFALTEGETLAMANAARPVVRIQEGLLDLFA
jgi:flagellar hook-length control protein FliK